MFAKSKFRSQILRFLATGLALALVVLLLSQQGWEEISLALSQIPLSVFLIALALMFLSRLFVVARWHILLRSGGIESSFQQSSRLTFAGLFATNFLPSTVGGDVVRMGGAIQVGFDAAVSAASLVVDRAIGFIGMALIVPLGLQKLFIFQSALASSMSMAQVGWITKYSNRARKILRKIVGALKIWLNKPGALILSLFASLLHMTSFFIAISLLLQAMGESLPLLQIAGLWALVYFVTLIPFTINALGLQEISISFAFSQLGGIDLANGLVLAILIRTLFMLASLPGAFFLSDLLPGIAKAQPILERIDDQS